MKLAIKISVREKIEPQYLTEEVNLKEGIEELVEDFQNDRKGHLQHLFVLSTHDLVEHFSWVDNCTSPESIFHTLRELGFSLESYQTPFEDHVEKETFLQQIKEAWRGTATAPEIADQTSFEARKIEHIARLSEETITENKAITDATTHLKRKIVNVLQGESDVEGLTTLERSIFDLDYDDYRQDESIIHFLETPEGEHYHQPSLSFKTRKEAMQQFREDDGSGPAEEDAKDAIHKL